MKKIFITVILFASVLANSQAQTSLWTANWDIAFGAGDTGDFIDKTSFGGFSVDGRYFVEENISIGGSFSWQVFHEIYKNLPPISIEESDGVQIDISGTQYRYSNIFPFLFTGHVYVDTSGSIKPYVGLGIGTIYIEERLDIGFVSLSDYSWGLGLQPSIGVFVPFGASSTGVNLAFKYTYGTNSGNFTDSLSMFNFSVGFGFLD